MIDMGLIIFGSLFIFSTLAGFIAHFFNGFQYIEGDVSVKRISS